MAQAPIEELERTVDKVNAWRLEQLLDAGYPPELAERIATSNADLHRAIELVKDQGCPPATAAAILI